MTTSRTKVLIVDDEPDILLMMRVNLDSEGFDTLLAADGETALERVRDESPDVVLLDVMMPVLDGWGVLENLASFDGPPRVIVVSAKAAPGDLTRAYRLGASDYVTKPFGIDGLIGVIREVLGRSPEDEEIHRRNAIEDLGVEA